MSGNKLPKSGSECEHDMHFVMGGGGIGTPQTREEVYICKNCGLFRVWATKNGQTTLVEFWLSSKDSVKFAGQYRKVLGYDRVEDEDRRIYNALSDEQRQILKASSHRLGTTVGTWEEHRMRGAMELVDKGYIRRGEISGRSLYFHISIDGRALLNSAPIKDKEA